MFFFPKQVKGAGYKAIILRLLFSDDVVCWATWYFETVKKPQVYMKLDHQSCGIFIF